MKSMMNVFPRMKGLDILLVAKFLVGTISIIYGLEEWNLPVFPGAQKRFHMGNYTQQDKLIPRHLWIAVKNSSEELPYQMAPLFARNKNWNVHVVGNEEKDKFMNEV